MYKFVGVREMRGNHYDYLEVTAADVEIAKAMVSDAFQVMPKDAASVKIMSPEGFEVFKRDRMRSLQTATYKKIAFGAELERDLADRNLMTMEPASAGKFIRKEQGRRTFGRARSPETAPALEEFTLVRFVIGEAKEIETIKAEDLEQAIRVGNAYMASPWGRMDDYSYVLPTAEYDLQERVRQSLLENDGPLKDLSENRLMAAKNEVMRCADEKDVLNALSIEPDDARAPFVVITWQKAMGISGRSNWQVESMVSKADGLADILQSLGCSPKSDLGILLTVVHEGASRRVAYEMNPMFNDDLVTTAAPKPSRPGFGMGMRH